MASADDLLEQWLAAGQDLLKARKGSEREAALEQRIAELETRFAAKPKDEREDALDELDEEERELIRAHRANKAKPDDVKPDPKKKAKPKEEEPPKATRPGRKSGQPYGWFVDDAGNVVKTDIPQIYNGEDEPDEVELPDADADAA